MSQKIPSPLTLDLTDTRAFKTWLYQLWQATGGTTDTAQDVVDNYVTPNFFDQATVTQSFDSSVLLQIQQEVAEITKRMDELVMQSGTITTISDDSQIIAKVDALTSRLDEIILFIGAPT